MEDKIEVGEYYRTKNGLIRKIKTIKSGKRQFTRTVETLINGRHRLEDIVKHSKQLKDLIESGDLIIYRLRGLKHQCKGFIRIYKDARSGKENLGIDYYSLEQIEIIKILTHEQIEANCYKVGGEDDGKGTNNK